MIVRLCSIECDFAHPLTHPNNALFQRDMEAWAKMSNRTYIWDYMYACCCVVVLLWGERVRVFWVFWVFWVF